MSESATMAIEQLTDRQRECLRLVPFMSSKEIAVQLGISNHTVDDHIKQAIRRLGVSSRGEAARAVIAHEAGAPPQRLGAQAEQLEKPLHFETLDLPDDPGTVPLPEQRLREFPSTFGSSEVAGSGAGYEADDEGQRLSPIQILMAVLALAVGIVILLSAAQPIAEGFQTISNYVDPFRRI